MTNIFISNWDIPTAKLACEVLKEFKIDYERYDPQTIADGYKFHNCTNLPKYYIPSYMKIRNENA